MHKLVYLHTQKFITIHTSCKHSQTCNSIFDAKSSLQTVHDFITSDNQTLIATDHFYHQLIKICEIDIDHCVVMG